MSDDYSILPPQLRTLASSYEFAVDCGTVFTKLIYHDQRNDGEISFQRFRSAELENNLKKICAHLKGKSITVSITGFNRYHAKSVVISLFSATVVLVDDYEAMNRGFGILLEKVKESDISFNYVQETGDRYKVDVNNPFIKRFLAKMDSIFPDCTIPDDGAIAKPAIVMWAGASVKFYLLGQDNSMTLISTHCFGGETLRGLAKYLIDSNDYSNITELALKGNKENVDTQVWEMFMDNEDSPYGSLPKRLPMFAFGKCGDQNIGLDCLNNEDIADSLTNFVVGDNLFVAMQLCQAYKTGAMYIGGGAFSAKIFDRQVQLRRNRLFRKIHTAMLNCD